MANEFLLGDWTYQNAAATVPRDHVRDLIADVDPNKPKVTDSRIALALVSCSDNVYLAAALLCRQIAAWFADRPDLSANGASERWSAVVENYMKMAEEYENIGNTQAGASGGPQAISHSLASLNAAEADTDRNWGPIAAAGSMLDSRYDPTR